MSDTRLRRRLERGRTGDSNGIAVWSAVIPLPKDESGRRRQARFTFRGNKKDAERAFLTALSKARDGTLPKRDRTTLGGYLVEWLSVAKLRLAATTHERYSSIVNVHVIPRLGSMPLQALTAAHLAKAYDAWLQSGLSAQTCQHHARLLHKVLADALLEEKIPRNVAALVKPPKVTRPEMRFLTIAELERLLRAAAGSPFELAFGLAISTGARRGELLGLRWSDVDLQRGLLTIARALTVTGRAQVAVKAPKGGKARLVSLTQSAVEMLKASYADRRPAPSDYVMPAPGGSGPWCPDDFSGGARRYFKRAGLPKVGIHALRHCYASLLIGNGSSFRLVQAAMGHSSPSITLSVYGHLATDALTDAAARLDAQIGHLITGSPE